MLILKDIIRRSVSNKMQLVSVFLVVAFFSCLLAFFFSVALSIGFQTTLIQANSIGDIVITSVLNDGGSVLDLQCYNDHTQQYDHNDFQQSLIDPNELSCLREDWALAYSGRLRDITTPARLLLPFDGLHLLANVSGVDFNELVSFDNALELNGISVDKKEGIIITSQIASILEENGISVEVSDYLRVEGDAHMIPTVSWDYAAPYMYLQLLAILPDSGGKLGISTEDRHNTLSCYVDYDSMQRLIGLNPKRKPTQKEEMQNSNIKLANVNIEHPLIPNRPKLTYRSLPNQIYVRISDDIDIEHALEEINVELSSKGSRSQKHIALRAEDFMELGTYQYALSEKIKTYLKEFFDSMVFYLCSALIFVFLFLILIDNTDRKRMRLQLNLGASLSWQYRYVILRDLYYTILPGVVGALLGIQFSFRYTESNYGFHKFFPQAILSSYLVYIVIIFAMSSLIFFLSKKGKEVL